MSIITSRTWPERSSWPKRVSVALIASTTLSAPIHAQQIEEVVVTAQRRSQNIQDVPISVVVMGEQALEQAQVSTLVDLPQVAPSLNFENRGVGAALSFSMRGVGAFAPNTATQPGVGLIVDEVPYSRNIEYDVDLGSVSSVQFLNGPQGTLFGANNIGGVILITTPDPSEVFEASVQAAVTSDEEFMVRAEASGPLSERVGGRVSLYMREREGFITNLYPGLDQSGTERRGGEESEGGRFKLEFDFTEDVNLKLAADYRRSYTTDASQITDVGGVERFAALQGNGDPVLGMEVVNDPEVINSDVLTYNSTETWGASAILSWGLSDTVSLKSITAYRELDLFGQLDFDASPARLSDPRDANVVLVTLANRGLYPEDDGQINSQCGCTGLKNFKQELRLEYSSEMINAVGGLYYVTEDNGQPDDLQPGATGGSAILRNGPVPILIFFNMANNVTNLDSWAAFGDVTWHITDSLDVFAGYRWTEETLDLDYYNRSIIVPPGFYSALGDTAIVSPPITGTITEFDAEYETDEWAGRFGFMWHMTDDINLYASVSRGFTGAGVVGSASSPADAFVSPTTALSYELGIKSILMDTVRLNLAFFSNNLEDIQSAFFDTAIQQNIIVNAGDFESQGAELDLSVALSDRWMMNAVATLMDTELTSDIFQPCYFGQTVAEGCVDTGGGVFAQNIKGKPGINAPDVKYTIGTTYDMPFATSPFDGRASLAYTWTDDRYYELIYDPIASLAPSYGTLDFTLGIVDKNGRYDVSLFGKNVLDEEFVTFSQSEAGRNGRVRGAYSRGSFAYWGLRANVNFF